MGRGPPRPGAAWGGTASGGAAGRRRRTRRAKETNVSPSWADYRLKEHSGNSVSQGEQEAQHFRADPREMGCAVGRRSAIHIAAVRRTLNRPLPTFVPPAATALGVAAVWDDRRAELLDA